MCTEHDQEGRSGERQSSKGIRSAVNGQTCTKEHTDTTALRTVLESGVQFGRCIARRRIEHGSENVSLTRHRDTVGYKKGLSET